MKALDQTKKKGPFVIIIGGPTGVGKSSIGLRLAQLWEAEIISADSRQIYRNLNIGTAKLSSAERQGIKHHLIDHISLKTNYSAAKFEQEALLIISKIHQKNPVCFVVGGTGLYIEALWKGIDPMPDVSPAIKNKIEKQTASRGISWLQEQIRLKDPDYYQRVDVKNPRRLIRALACIEQSGKPFSSFLTQTPKIRPFQVIPLLIVENRELLYDRINSRVDMMMQQGLLEEVKGLWPYRHLPALQTVGYQELFAYLEGEIDLEEAKRLIKRNSRRYAKRQMTWFKKHGEWHQFKPGPFDQIRSFVNKALES